MADILKTEYSEEFDRLTELLDENGKRFISKLYDSMQGWQDMRKEDEGK